MDAFFFQTVDRARIEGEAGRCCEEPRETHVNGGRETQSHVALVEVNRRDGSLDRAKGRSDNRKRSSRRQNAEGNCDLQIFTGEREEI